MDRSYVERNRAELERLRSVVARLSLEDMGRALGHEWTVAAALAHMAFWDRYMVATFEEWERIGEPPARGDFNTLNDAMLAEWLAIPPQHAARLAVEAAEKADQKVAALDPQVLEAVLAAGRSRMLERAPHRREHIEEIERAISK